MTTHTTEIYASTAAFASGRVAMSVVVRDPDGHTVTVATRVFGTATREEAAYRALLYGLWRAKRAGAQRVRVYTDHVEVVAQLHGNSEVPSALVGLYLQVRAMLNAYRWRSLETIDRTRNAEAALAAMEALDRPPDSEEVETLPLWRSGERALV